MPSHPVRLRVESPAHRGRVHVLIRIILLAAVCTVGGSSVYWLLYLALPAMAALIISDKGAEAYLSENGPEIARVLRWLAAAYAYLLLLTDAFPTSSTSGPVTLEIETGGSPTIATALSRLLTSLPALLLLAVLSLAASVIWLAGAVEILVRRRVSPTVADWLAMTLRYQLRLIAYHLSIVDRYPSVEAPITTNFAGSDTAR